MTTAWMKRLDSWLGLPICLLLSLPNAPFRWLRRRRPGSPQRILLVKFFGLGSLVLAKPLLHALRRSFPKARILFLTFDANRTLLEKFPEIDEVLGLCPESVWRMCSDGMRTLFRLRAFKPDTTLDLEYFSKFSSLVCFASGGRTSRPSRLYLWV